MAAGIASVGEGCAIAGKLSFMKRGFNKAGARLQTAQVVIHGGVLFLSVPMSIGLGVQSTQLPALMCLACFILSRDQASQLYFGGWVLMTCMWLVGLATIFISFYGINITILFFNHSLF